MLELNENMNAHLARLQATQLPNVLTDTINGIATFNNNEGSRTDIIDDILVNLSDQDLKKLHEISLNKNVPWKCQHIAQLQFRQNVDNAGVLTSRAKACKDALNSAMEVYFAQVYWRDGSYDHKAFTDDILEAIKDKAEEVGEARGVATGKGKGTNVYMS